MFAKRPKKVFPPGTFIPKPARIVAILQLCFAFTMILYFASYPFMGALFEHKSKTLLYRTVMGDIGLASSASNEQAQQSRDLLQRNHDRFKQLPAEQRDPLIAQYDILKNQDNTTFLQKVGKSIHIFLFDLPPFELTWIVFSIVIALMLLLRIEGAAQAAWLLPIIVACYAGNNYWQGVEVPINEDIKLFPTEEVIVRDFLKKPLPADIGEQHRQLMLGWKMYLIQMWAHQQPASDSIVFERQAEEGEFYFNLARLQAASKHYNQPKTWYEKESPFLLLIYFLWNCFFAWTVTRKRNRVCQTLSN